MLTLHLEADTLAELQRQALAVLGLANVPLPIEDAPKVTATAEIPEKPEITQPEPTIAPEPAKKRAPRKAKDEPSITEIADSLTAPQPAKPQQLTLDSVRAAFDQYVKKFGVQAAQIDGPILMGRIYGNGMSRIKDLPEDDQGKLGRIIAAVEGAILTNEFKRPAVQ